MAELTFFHRHRHGTFSQASQMLLGELQRRCLISRHHVEVQQPLSASHPRVKDMDSIGLGLSHRK
jgi:hypothetical protein